MSDAAVQDQMPLEILFSLKRDDSRPLKYGENPGQKAAIYNEEIKVRYPGGELTDFASGGGFMTWTQHTGPTIGWNNAREIVYARRLLDGYDDEDTNPTVISTKHGIVCALGQSPDVLRAYKLAEDGDPFSAFGGILGMNAEMDMATVDYILNQGGRGYREIIGSTQGFAPGVTDKIQETTGLANLRIRKKNEERKLKNQSLPKEKQLPLLREKRMINTFTFTEHSNFPYQAMRMDGVWLVGEPTDLSRPLDRSKFTYPTNEKPTEEDLELLIALNKVVKRVPSNAIVIGDGVYEEGRVNELWTYGVGTNTKRVGAAFMVQYVAHDPWMLKSGQLNLSDNRKNFKSALAASDGFFPYSDGLERIIKGENEYRILGEILRLAALYAREMEMPSVKIKDLSDFLTSDKTRLNILDGYFQELNTTGIRAVIVPGVTSRPKIAANIIRLANEYEIAMVFDNDRHFFH